MGEFETAYRERGWIWATGALLPIAARAWKGSRTTTAEDVRREVTAAWWVAIAAVPGPTLALGRC